MNSDTYWLNLTNIALGVVTGLCVLAILRGVVIELFAHRQEDPES